MSNTTLDTIPTDWDRTSRLAVKKAPDMFAALAMNPHPKGSKERLMWLDLTRAKWAIVHNSTCLIAARS